MLTYSNMQYKELKEKAKKAGVRVTKDVRGKRVKLTAKELRAKIRLNFENSVKNAQQVIRVCRTIVGPGPQMTMRPSGVPPPPRSSTAIFEPFCFSTTTSHVVLVLSSHTRISLPKPHEG